MSPKPHHQSPPNTPQTSLKPPKRIPETSNNHLFGGVVAESSNNSTTIPLNKTWMFSGLISFYCFDVGLLLCVIALKMSLIPSFPNASPIPPNNVPNMLPKPAQQILQQCPTSPPQTFQKNPRKLKKSKFV